MHNKGKDFIVTLCLKKNHCHVYCWRNRDFFNIREWEGVILKMYRYFIVVFKKIARKIYSLLISLLASRNILIIPIHKIILCLKKDLLQNVVRGTYYLRKQTWLATKKSGIEDTPHWWRIIRNFSDLFGRGTQIHLKCVSITKRLGAVWVNKDYYEVYIINWQTVTQRTKRDHQKGFTFQNKVIIFFLKKNMKHCSNSFQYNIIQLS